jgi:16S rRNA (cytosine1402-N4)-methyltransferase
MYDSFFHHPVLLPEAVSILINKELDNQVLIDCTTGGGGYSEEICKRLRKNFKLLCLDKDLNALEFSRKRLRDYEENIIFTKGNFGNLKNILEKNNLNTINGIVLDLGLSTYQLDKEDGFSYLNDTPLDMRADKDDELTAEKILNEYSKNRLTEVFSEYGEIGNAQRLSNGIAENRKHKKIKTTFDLVSIVNSEYKIGRKNLYDFLAKIFQAIRIEINNELENLKTVLSDSIDLLVPGGRIVVVSYHSLEDRIVKNFFRENSEKKNGLFKVLTKKPIVPAREEVKSNVRSRSAKLRAAEKI